jgi:hypothetical protein
MKAKVFSFATAALLGLTLSAHADMTAVVSNFYGGASGITYQDPGFDTYRIRCGGPTAIRAFVWRPDESPISATMICVAPPAQIGKAAKELAWPQRVQASVPAQVTRCQEAVLVMGTALLDNNDAENHYGVTIECKDQTIQAPELITNK